MMLYRLPLVSFRRLTDEEIANMRTWARENYIPGSEISLLWHPACRAECELMNLESVQRTSEDVALEGAADEAN